MACLFRGPLHRVRQVPKYVYGARAVVRDRGRGDAIRVLAECKASDAPACAKISHHVRLQRFAVLFLGGGGGSQIFKQRAAI